MAIRPGVRGEPSAIHLELVLAGLEGTQLQAFKVLARNPLNSSGRVLPDESRERYGADWSPRVAFGPLGLSELGWTSSTRTRPDPDLTRVHLRLSCLDLAGESLSAPWPAEPDGVLVAVAANERSPEEVADRVGEGLVRLSVSRTTGPPLVFLRTDRHSSVERADTLDQNLNRAGLPHFAADLTAIPPLAEYDQRLLRTDYTGVVRAFVSLSTLALVFASARLELLTDEAWDAVGLDRSVSRRALIVPVGRSLLRLWRPPGSRVRTALGVWGAAALIASLRSPAAVDDPPRKDRP